MITYYDLLGVRDADADAEGIKRAYHRKAQLLDPDRHAAGAASVQREAEAAMKTINDAWSTLKDPDRRHEDDLENGLHADHGTPVDDGPDADRLRPVADDECELCGSAPGTPVVLRQETGKIIWRTRRRTEGTFCRDCGLALFRSTQNRTLMTGWWGVISFFVTITSVLANAAAWAKVRRLADPRRHPAVVSYLAAPLDAGSPLYRRAGVWFAAVVLLIGGAAAAGEDDRGTYTTPSYSSSGSTPPYNSLARNPSPPSYGATSGGGSGYTSSDTWTEADRSQLRSAGMRAGLSYADADCIVRYLTNRYSRSQSIGQTAFELAGDYCLRAIAPRDSSGAHRRGVAQRTSPAGRLRRTSLRPWSPGPAHPSSR